MKQASHTKRKRGEKSPSDVQRGTAKHQHGIKLITGRGSSIPSRIPPEILENIALQVEIQHAPSVAVFALASRQCYAAAAAVLFREIKIVIDQENFAPLVAALKDRLRHGKAFGHVRNLVVTCLSTRPIAQDNPDWHSIVGLLTVVRGLENFIFNCDSRHIHGHIQTTSFPRIVFYGLREHHPLCHLHLHVCPDWLTDLYDPTPSSYQLDLITSPLLHSLTLGFRSTFDLDSDGFSVYCEEELMFVLGVAPHLKDVLISRHAAGWSPGIAEALKQGRSKSAWPGFHPGNLPEPHKVSERAKLRRLHFRSEEPLSPESIRTWLSRIDSTALETLELEIFLRGQAVLGDYLFSLLKKASAQLTYPGSERHPDAVRESWLAWEQVLCQDHPLAALTINDGLSHILWKQVLPRIGTHLTFLRLDTSEDGRIGGEIADQLKVNCRLLEDLTITIKRTQGDHNEVQIYRALGALPRLQHLFLTLEASNRSVLKDPEDDSDDEDTSPIISDNDPSFDDFDQQKFKNSFRTYRWPRNGHIRLALINSALDKALALAIFECISAAKPIEDGTRPLEFLQVRIKGGGDLGQHTTGWGTDPYPFVFRELMHCWVLKRNVRDDCREQIVITDGGQLDEMRRAPWFSAEDEEEERSLPLPPELVPVFRRIWPARTSDEAANWREEWYGLPLML